jgi:hypothetical protein
MCFSCRIECSRGTVLFILVNVLKDRWWCIYPFFHFMHNILAKIIFKDLHWLVSWRNCCWMCVCVVFVCNRLGLYVCHKIFDNTYSI